VQVLDTEYPYNLVRLLACADICINSINVLPFVLDDAPNIPRNRILKCYFYKF